MTQTVSSVEVLPPLSRVDRLFAHDVPARLWFALVPLLFVAAVALMLGPLPAALQGDSGGLRYLALLGMAWLGGLCAAGLTGWMWLGPVYRRQAVRNGAPFLAGDRVRLLIGPASGRATRVIEAWDWRGQLLVEDPLAPGEDRRLLVRDLQVLRIIQDDDAVHG